MSNFINPLEYESYIKRHIPGRIMRRLNEELRVLAKQTKYKLTQIVEEESLSLLKDFALQKDGGTSTEETASTLSIDKDMMNFEYLEGVDIFEEGEPFNFNFQLLGEYQCQPDMSDVGAGSGPCQYDSRSPGLNESWYGDFSSTRHTSRLSQKTGKNNGGINALQGSATMIPPDANPIRGIAPQSTKGKERAVASGDAAVFDDAFWEHMHVS